MRGGPAKGTVQHLWAYERAGGRNSFASQGSKPSPVLNPGLFMELGTAELGHSNVPPLLNLRQFCFPLLASY